jgi:hypothetical protein
MVYVRLHAHNKDYTVQEIVLFYGFWTAQFLASILFAQSSIDEPKNNEAHMKTNSRLLLARGRFYILNILQMVTYTYTYER